MPSIQLERLNCKTPGKGHWGMADDPDTSSVVVRNMLNGLAHRVYYGTGTGRTLETSTRLATALCAVLNATKARSF